jgi:hypothetical protein
MTAAFPIHCYGYHAIEAMARLPLSHQRQIEWLRANRLAGFADNRTAAVFSNWPEMEYEISVTTATLAVKIRYYIRRSDNQVVIFAII